MAKLLVIGAHELARSPYKSNPAMEFVKIALGLITPTDMVLPQESVLWNILPPAYPTSW